MFVVLKDSDTATGVPWCEVLHHIEVSAFIYSACNLQQRWPADYMHSAATHQPFDRTKAAGYFLWISNKWEGDTNTHEKELPG